MLLSENKRNLNQKCTVQKMASAQEAFECFDWDGDGNITTHELGLALRSLGHDPSEVRENHYIQNSILKYCQAELHQLVEECGDGALIGFQKFEAIRAKVGGMSEQDLVQAFKVGPPIMQLCLMFNLVPGF